MRIQGFSLFAHHLVEDYFMQSHETIHESIVRLFSGEAGNEEKSRVEAWLNLESGNRKLFHDLREIWLSSGVKNNTDDYNVEHAIQQFKQKTSFLEKMAPAKNFLPKFFRYAAIFILILMLPITYYFGKRSTTGEDTMTTITCAAGDKTTVVLPDSTKVFLNSDSKLTFNNNFRNGSRQVALEGEAYFQVRKDPENPFRVSTSDLDVEVLGTEFNLKAYAGEPTITTTLVTGSLEVSSRKESIRINPNQKLVFDKAAGKMLLVDSSDLAPETEWKNGRFVFRNCSLDEMEHQLERWFDVEITFADEQVKNRRFTGTLEHESILEVVSFFGRSNYVAYQINDNQITFYTESPMN